jgi:lipopolysaccharide export system permease protein
MLIFRYLTKEVLSTLAALTIILLLIFMSNQIVIYLNRAAHGHIPGIIILKVMILELPNLLGVLLPLGFYIAVLLSYARLYNDNEIIVLQACGYSRQQLLRHSLILASAVIVTTSYLVYLNPSVAYKRAELLQNTGIQTLIQTILPGNFRSTPSGDTVFYVTKINKDHNAAQDIFLAKKNPDDFDIIWADNAYLQRKHGDIILRGCKKYKVKSGSKQFTKTELKRYQANLPRPKVKVKNDMRTVPLSKLWPFKKDDYKKSAELQWRISVPFMVLPLTIIAVALSRVKPRTGKFSALLPAILLYFIYANLLFFGKNIIVEQKLSPYCGMWIIHACMLLTGIALFNNKRFKR